MLRAWVYHAAWSNTRALELVGIDANSPDPVLEEILRREDATPLGTLRESGAIDELSTVFPPLTIEQRVGGLRRATLHYASLGVTWVQDTWAEGSDIDAYLAAAEKGVLSIRIRLALLADPRNFPASPPALSQARARVESMGPSTRLTASSFLQTVL
jgi:predicted amidohydrolase YtcJ